MEKISVRLLVLAAAIVAPNMFGSDDQSRQVKHVDQIGAAELEATARVVEFCAYTPKESDEKA